MNIPNILTTLRFFMIPFYIGIFAHESDYKLWSAVIFMLASATDVLDGYIARKYNLTTKWGQLMDPLADKLMQITVIVSMLITSRIPLWFVILSAAKEGLMILGGIFLFTKKTYVRSNIFGKLNTVVLFAALCLLLVCPQINPVLKTIILALSITLSIFAMVTYTYSYLLKKKKFKEYIPGKHGKSSAHEAEING